MRCPFCSTFYDTYRFYEIECLNCWPHRPLLSGYSEQLFEASFDIGTEYVVAAEYYMNSVSLYEQSKVYTSFLKKVVRLNGLIDVNPENAAEVMQRLLNLKAFA